MKLGLRAMWESHGSASYTKDTCTSNKSLGPA